MLEEIEGKIKSEIEKIINKESLSVEEISFLIDEKKRLECEKARVETSAEMQQALQTLFKTSLGSSSH